MLFRSLLDRGASNIALIRGIAGADDIAAATRLLKEKLMNRKERSAV